MSDIPSIPLTHVGSELPRDRMSAIDECEEGSPYGEAATMKDDDLSDPSREKLKVQTLKMVGRVFGISREEAESIYCQVMHEPPPAQLAREPTWTSKRPTTPGLYWYRRHAADKPVIVQIWKLKNGTLRARYLDLGIKCAAQEGEWAGLLDQTH